MTDPNEGYPGPDLPHIPKAQWDTDNNCVDCTHPHNQHGPRGCTHLRVPDTAIYCMCTVRTPQ